MAGYRLLRRARQDVLEIADFTARRWGNEQAEHYIAQLYTGFEALAVHPDLRRPYRGLSPYWRALVTRHAIFYRVDDEGEILIVRILHAAMHPELHLPGSEGEEEDDDP